MKQTKFPHNRTDSDDFGDHYNCQLLHNYSAIVFWGTIWPNATLSFVEICREF